MRNATVAMAVKPDFPPLLAPGYHVLNLDALHCLCVAPYPTIQNRRYLFLHLEQMIQDLLLHAIFCDAWIDGSFLTEHPNPGDIDVIIKLDYDVVSNLTVEQRDFIDILNSQAYNERIDTFVFACVPLGHDLYY
jgi:hypothetical protein